MGAKLGKNGASISSSPSPSPSSVRSSSSSASSTPSWDPCELSAKNFKFIGLLGTGASAEVYLAKKLGGSDHGQLYAVKILPKKEKKKGWQGRRVLESVGQMQDPSPFLLQLYYAWQSDTHLWLVFDFLPGGELFIHLKQNRRFQWNTVQVGLSLHSITHSITHSLTHSDI